MWALQEFSTRYCELVSPLRGISCASSKLSRLRRSRFVLDFPRVRCSFLESIAYRIESLTKTMKKGKKVHLELQTLYGACRVLLFVLKSSKSQDILVKIGCFTQNGDLSNTQGNLKGESGLFFDPVLTLWGGGHIGSSRMEQSYCTSGFFRQRVTARNHSNYQPMPRRRSIIAYGKRENARRDKCVAVCVMCFISLAAPFYAFQTFPGKAQLFIRFSPSF